MNVLVKHKRWAHSAESIKAENDFSESNHYRFLVPVIVVGAIVLFLVYFFAQNPKAFDGIIRTYGLPGLFIATVIANATILLPVPIDIFVVLFGQANFYNYGVFSPLILGLTVGIGAAIGEMFGYLVGYFSMRTWEDVRKHELHDQIEQFSARIQEKGMYFVALAAFIPFPFDIIGMACGFLKFRAEKFFIAAAIGKSVRYIVLAYAGFYGVGWLRTLLGV